jgi:putative membrane protein
MRFLLVNWILTALGFLAIAHLVSGFRVSGFGPALLAALTLVTFGLFLLVINALMLLLASALVPGFQVTGFGPAFLAAILLAVLNTIVRHVLL